MTSTAQLITNLIQIPSLSGQETELVLFVSKFLKKLNLRPKIIQGNVTCLVPGNDSSRALIYNAHVDTVEPGDLKLWQHDPFSGHQSQNKIWGLGASDEKSGVASLLLLIKMLTHQPPPGDVWFQFVTKEELDGSGTKDMLNWFLKKFAHQYQALAAVLVEPTGLESIELGHKGNAFLKLTVTGQSGHGSQPDALSSNSVLVMGQVLTTLVELHHHWQSIYQDPILGSPSIGVGTSIQAGSAQSPNKFADVCVATIDVRTIPEMHHQVLSLIKDHLNDFAVTVDYLQQPAPYGITDHNDSLVQAAQMALPKAAVTTSGWSTDQCFFSEKGIPAIIVGPGEKDCIHQPNEYCYVHKVDQAVEVYSNVIKAWFAATSALM